MLLAILIPVVVVLLILLSRRKGTLKVSGLTEVKAFFKKLNFKGLVVIGVGVWMLLATPLGAGIWTASTSISTSFGCWLLDSSGANTPECTAHKAKLATASNRAVIRTSSIGTGYRTPPADPPKSEVEDGCEGDGYDNMLFCSTFTLPPKTSEPYILQGTEAMCIFNHPFYMAGTPEKDANGNTIGYRFTNDSMFTRIFKVYQVADEEYSPSDVNKTDPCDL